MGILKKIIKVNLLFWFVLGLFGLTHSCKKDAKNKVFTENPSKPSVMSDSTNSTPLTQEFKRYWFAGEAEISSYQLEQARYGELRQGKAVLVYVTEPFLPDKQVKAEHSDTSTMTVLKLNATKTFNTGIYPYSIMQSTFYPLGNNAHAFKVSCSVQEWCGHVYTQINNRDSLEVTSHSYFENEADERFKLEKAIVENELWTKLRIDPNALPTGALDIIPALEFNRLRHVPIKAYKAFATLEKQVYTLEYPELKRSLSITFNPEFPHDILKWEETIKSGPDTNSTPLTTKATKLKTIKSPYWQKNSNKDEVLRDTLQLN